MDYFSELLESYGKLKKRTFKLTYINEQEGALVNQEAEKLVRQYIATAPQIEKATEQELASVPTVNGVDGQPTQYKVFFNKLTNNVAVRELGPTGTLLLVKNGQEQPKGIKIFSDVLAGVDKPSKKEAAAIDSTNATANSIQQQQAALASPGAALTSMGANPKVIENVQKAAQSVLDLPNMEWFKGDKLLQTKPNVKNLEVYTNPQNPQSFEFKLTNATAFTADANGDLIEGEVPAGLLEEVSKSNDLLISFLKDEIPDENCKALKHRVGYYGKNDGKKIVLFGGSKDEGIAFTPNYMQKIALERATQKCESANVEIVKTGVTKEKFLNDLRGKLAEHTLVFITESTSTNPLVRELAKKRFISMLATRKRQYMRAARFFSERFEVGSVDLQSLGFGEAVTDLNDLFGNNDALKQLLANIASTTGKMRREAGNPDYIRHVGKEISGGDETDTGRKADVVFQYVDEVAAKSFASKYGAEATFNEEYQRFEVAVSQKFLQKLTDSNAGEIKGGGEGMRAHWGRQNPMSVDLIDLIDSKLFPDPAEADASLKLFNDIENHVQKTVEGLVENRFFLDVTGKPKTQNAQKTCKDLVKLLKSELSFEIDNSEIEGMLSSEYDTTESRQRLAEYVSRRIRMQKYKEAINNPETRIMAAKTLFKLPCVAGYSKDNAITFLGTEDGNALTFKTNSIFDRISQAMNNGTFDPTNADNLQFTLAGAKFNITEGGKSFGINLKTEGYESKVGRSTLFKATVDAQSMVNANQMTNMVPEQPIQADTLYQFLHGQMKLLETLLSKPRVNPVH
jgi:hypothetical protein